MDSKSPSSGDRYLLKPPVQGYVLLSSNTLGGIWEGLKSLQTGYYQLIDRETGSKVLLKVSKKRRKRFEILQLALRLLDESSPSDIAELSDVFSSVNLYKGTSEGWVELNPEKDKEVG